MNHHRTLCLLPPELAAQLGHLPASQTCADTESFLAALNAADWALVLVSAPDAGAEFWQALLGTQALKQSEWLLFSDGEPNELLDRVGLEAGAFHFRTPFPLADVRQLLAEIAAEFDAETDSDAPTATSGLAQFGALAGSSGAMRKLYRQIRKVAPTEQSVMILGESGVGKELVARTLHQASDRAEGPFVAINCGALPDALVESELFGHERGAFTGAVKGHKGVFEQARGGTLFLDEVAEMSLDHQVKLLRVLESGEFRPLGRERPLSADVRVVCATNRTPEQEVAAGRFREDLYFRLAQWPLQVPPLRARAGDRVGLAEHFLAYTNSREGRQVRLSAAARAAIEDYDWPGNVRELKHCIGRACLLADDQIEPRHLMLRASAGDLAGQVPAGVPLASIERAAILNTLAAAGGNKTLAASQLGISVKTLYNKLAKYEQKGLQA